jgi:dipeptidyl aminopeptidase/acylaminoacyl peptidase
MRHIACAGLVVLLTAAGAAQGQEKTVTPPPSLTTEGIPPIPQSVADGLARYAQFRQALLGAWHPVKRQIVITTALGGTPQFYSIDGPGRDRHQLTWYEPRGVSPVATVSFDPADPNSMVFLFDPDGLELRSLYRYDMATGAITLVSSSKIRYAQVWARAGKWVAFDSVERNGKDRDLYVMQPGDPKTKRRLFDAEGSWQAVDWTPDGATLIANEVVANAETYLWRVDVKTGERKAITPRDGEKVAWFEAVLSADGRKVYAKSDRQGGEWRIWRCDLANCVWSAVTPEGVRVDNVGSYALSSDGTLVAVVVDRGSTTELQLIDTTTLKARTVTLPTQGSVSQLRWRPGSRELGFTLASVKAQGDVYSVDASLGTVTRWTTSETSFNADILPPPEVVEWKSFDGTAISGVLYRPPASFAGPRPVLVNIHGGPGASERARWQGRSNYLLNELGMAILFPNVRGSGNFGRKFEQMDNGTLREGAVKDIGAALDWIATRPDLDKNRVVLSGASYGGWLSLEAGIYYNDRIRGIIEGAGISDFVTFLEQDADPSRQTNRRAEYGDERDPQTAIFLKSISPVTRAQDLKKPTFILHPAKDARVPVAQARELLDALKKNNATVWYAEFADANHDGFPNNQPNLNWMLAAWVAFLKAYVLN